jgi:tetratricopeptide (TPR) repeat protein
MGNLFRDRGDFVVAEEWYRKAIDHSPDDAQGHIYLGTMLAGLGRLDDAEQVHRKAIACKAGCIDEAYYNLGLVLRARERYAEALECFDRALSIDPQYKVARLAKRDVQNAMRVGVQSRRGSELAPRLI